MPADPAEKVGIVGLGTMGGAIGRHLLDAGYDVLGYDVAPAPLHALEAAGGRPVASPAQLVSEAELIITSLPSVAAFDAVIAGEGGLLQASSPGFTVIETSTLPLDSKENARQRLAEQGSELLDCPLSGTGAQMRAKDVVVYASGDPDTISRHRAVLAAFSRSQLDVGPFGNGSKIKFIANLLVTIHNVSTAEALLLARTAGLDLPTVVHAISDGAGSSRMLEVRGPVMTSGDYSDATMKVETYQKDIDIISSFARTLRCPVPLFLASAQFHLAALAQGRGDQDTASVFAVLEGLLRG